MLRAIPSEGQVSANCIQALSLVGEGGGGGGGGG